MFAGSRKPQGDLSPCGFRVGSWRRRALTGLQTLRFTEAHQDQVKFETCWDCSGCFPGQSICGGVKKSSLEQPREQETDPLLHKMSTRKGFKLR